MLTPEIEAHYAAGKEESRLSRGLGRLEFFRTLELLHRYLPFPPAKIFDVGGGTGVYALPLAARGYEVHLLDASPLHVERAQLLSQKAVRSLASVELGDARKLEQPEASFDAVLLFGPLYHLIERTDRVAALREVARVLKPGGVLLAAYVSRFASACDGIQEGMLREPEFAAIVARDLIDGVHLNPTQNPGWFTTAYFHHPFDIRLELEDADLEIEQLLAIEGPGWVNADLDAWLDHPEERERLLTVLRTVESEPTLLGASAHLLSVSRRMA